jgi:GT2 family glycosyltransferase
MHQVSVIISNFNGAKYLPRLIETLHAQQGVELEIIVVDRNSSDGSDSILAQHPEITVIKHPPETGLVCGYAVGGDAAKHDLLYFCNEDMWYEPDCLRQLCERIDLEKQIAAVMPVQWTYDGADIVNCGAWFSKSAWCRSNPYPFRVSHWHLPARTTETSGINAGACLIHRAVYDEIGGWDRSFFLDYEDMDLSLRLWQHGWKCLVVPEAKVYHAVGASNSKAISGGTQKVSRKRYIDGGSNVPAIALKTFTGFAVLWPFLTLADRFLRNVVRLRVERAWWDVLIFFTVLQRLPDLLGFRRLNKRWNWEQPGQNFFTDPAFDYQTIRDNRDPRSTANVDS